MLLIDTYCQYHKNDWVPLIEYLQAGNTN
jgi:hypothetical protein